MVGGLGVGAVTGTEQSSGPCLQHLLEQDTVRPHWPLLTSFFPLPGFQELYWNTKPGCQRHLASAVFHHKTLRHENFLPCSSSDARSACCALALLERLPGWATVPPGSISSTEKLEFIFRFDISSCVTATPLEKHTLSHPKPSCALISLQLSLANFSLCH